MSNTPKTDTEIRERRRKWEAFALQTPLHWRKAELSVTETEASTAVFPAAKLR